LKNKKRVGYGFLDYCVPALWKENYKLQIISLREIWRSQTNTKLQTNYKCQITNKFKITNHKRSTKYRQALGKNYKLFCYARYGITRLKQKPPLWRFLFYFPLALENKSAEIGSEITE